LADNEPSHLNCG